MKKVLKILLEILVTFMCAICAVSAFGLYISATVGVSGESMKPTIHESGSNVKIWTNFYNIERGDIIVFYRPDDAETHPIEDNPARQKVTFGEFFETVGDTIKSFFSAFDSDFKLSHTGVTEVDGYSIIIKRVIAVSGDTVRIRNSKLYIQYGSEGEFVLQDEDYINSPMVSATDTVSGKYGVYDGEWVVAENELFVMGDNRNISYDSEDYGPISTVQVWGKVYLLKQDDKSQILD